MSKIIWDIRREGRAWKAGEAHSRHDLIPGKMEMIDGKLFWTDDDRVTMLGLMLENVGIDKAIRLGNANAWRRAISELDD